MLRPVRLIQPEQAGATLARSFFGRIVARETVDLSFEVNGRLEVLDVTEGDQVIEGEVLAQLDLAPFERAVERAELSLLQAERDAERANALARSNATSRVQADDAETARDLAEVALREARDDLEDATIRAPYTGLVASRIAANFSNVSAGQPILRLHDMSQVRVEIDVPERLIQRVGNPERIDFSASLPAIGGDVPLELVEFQAETAAIGQSYVVTLALPAVRLASLLVPGASVTVTATLPGARDGLSLPASAVLSGPDRDAAVLAFEPTGAEEGTLRRVAVNIRSETGTEFIVDGLPQGTEIVGAGAHLLREGQAVRRYTGLTVEED